MTEYVKLFRASKEHLIERKNMLNNGIDECKKKIVKNDKYLKEVNCLLNQVKEEDKKKLLGIVSKIEENSKKANEDLKEFKKELATVTFSLKYLYEKSAPTKFQSILPGYDPYYSVDSADQGCSINNVS